MKIRFVKRNQAKSFFPQKKSNGPSGVSYSSISSFAV